MIIHNEKLVSHEKRIKILEACQSPLTTGGFADYLEQIYAYGASNGVMFSVREAA